MTDTIATPQVYDENLQFWQRAWNMVKTPYTQMPELDYLAKIPICLEPYKSSLVLDLGCGSGWLAVYLARVGFSVVGVDVANHAIELGKTWAAKESLAIDFQTQDISELNFPAGHFGGIVANSIFEHLTLELATKTVETLHNLLESGGIFLGCFDKVGTGPGEYYKLNDGTQVYTDKGRQGMMLRCFSENEIETLFQKWKIEELSQTAGGSRFVIAKKA